MSPARATAMQRIHNLSIRSRILFAGSVLMVTLLTFVTTGYFSYRDGLRGQEVARLMQQSVYGLQVALDRSAQTPSPKASAAPAQQQVLSGVERALRTLQQNYAAEAPLPSGIDARWDAARRALSDPASGDREAARQLAEMLHQRLLQDNRDQAHVNGRNAVVLGALFVLIALSIVVLFYWLHHNIAGRLDRMNRVITHMEGSGDLSLRLKVTADDEIGYLAQTCNSLAAKTEEMMQQQQQAKTDLDEMIEIILEVVQAAAKGDLTKVFLEFHGKNRVDLLANGVRAMIDNLNTLISAVRESGFQVTHSTSEIAASGAQQEATTSELAATSNQISASATEIAVTSKELVASMDEVFGVMQIAASAAAQGQDGIDTMEQSMRAMVNAVDIISGKLQTLSEKTANVNMVVSTIAKVADQTNLLSLNAAIEAEKAGEFGRGFSVVATEIRRLADQTAVSTWDIEQMVKEMQSSTTACVMAMEKVSGEIHKGVDNVSHVGTQLTEIIDKVQTMLPGFESVKESIHAQSEGAGQISDSIRQLNQSAQETADSLRRSNHAVHRLKEAVQVLNNAVARFTVG